MKTSIVTLIDKARDDFISGILAGYFNPGSQQAGDPAKCLELIARVDGLHADLQKAAEGK
jgi:hypothetical protein